jgi:DNA modification methylase
LSCGNFIGPYACCSVVNEDSRIALQMIPRDTNAVILTDPPYGIAHPCDYGKRGRSNLAKAYDYANVANDDEPFDPTYIVEAGFPTCLWGANYFCQLLPISNGWLVWDKMRPPNLDQATVELAWTNFVKGARRFQCLWNGMIRDPNSTEALIHPTQKPVRLSSWVLDFTLDDAIVIDLYCGSGSSLVAAKRAGRHFLGFDLSQDYCQKATEWLARTTFVGQNLFTKPQRSKVHPEEGPTFFDGTD